MFMHVGSPFNRAKGLIYIYNSSSLAALRILSRLKRAGRLQLRAGSLSARYERCIYRNIGLFENPAIKDILNKGASHERSSSYATIFARGPSSG